MLSKYLMIAPLLFATAVVPVDRPKRYLLSIVDVPLGRDEALEQFAIATWGVDVDAVCHIPDGWHITAGRRSNPEGRIAGSGSNGATWPRERNPAALRNLMLVTLYAPVQPRARDAVPPTFAGTASIVGADAERKAALSRRNVHLVPAEQCPPLPRRTM